MTEPPKFLFIPVSGPGGAGEYYRSLAIAGAVERRWPGCAIRFVLSRDARYGADTPYPVTYVASSPTHETREVVAILERERPDVVVFDSAGRVAQCRRAKELGARVVFVSSRATTRRKGFLPRRMRWTDQHWVVAPRFAGRQLGALERLSLCLAPSCEVVFMEAMHEPVDVRGTREVQKFLGIEVGRYVLVCPGSGGIFDDGPDAARVYYEAACSLARDCGLPVVAVLGARFAPPSGGPAGLHVLEVLPNAVLMGMLGDARVGVVNGGSLLLQAIAIRAPCVSAPIAGDQPPRISEFAARGCVRRAALDASSIAIEATALITDDAARMALLRGMESLGLRNGVDCAVESIARLVPATSRPVEGADATRGADERLRVMHVILSSGFAGSERAAAEACNAMCPLHDVALVIRNDHRGPGGASIRDHVNPRVRIIEVPGRLGTRRQLAEAIRSWRPDVIHTHLRRGTRYVAKIGAGPPHFCTLHLSLNGPHYLWSDGLFCISEWQVGTVPPTYRGRLFLLGNSLVPQPHLDAAGVRRLRAELGAGDDDFVIGGVGRLVRSKGFDTLVRAFEEAALPAGRLVIVGEGYQRGRLERMAGTKVTLTGFRDDVKDLYQAFDLFVCPSRNEPFGRVIIEALDAGTPVVSTDTRGPRDIARRFPMELVPVDDVATLAGALRRAATRPRQRVVLDLSEFNVDSVVARMLEAYSEVLAVRRVQVARHVTERPRYLFSPVSGPHGAGELMRCLIIARELVRKQPEAEVHFLVSRTAVFREAVEFPIHDCDASPTRSTAQVLGAIDGFSPHVVVFDNSGRTAQLKAARRAGARVVFSSRAPHLRRKAFRLKWMRLLDEHWMVFPRFVTGELGWSEKLKLRLFPHYRCRHLDTLFPPSEPGARSAWLASRGLVEGQYVVFVPGGRGESSGVARPTELFAAAARDYVARTGAPAVVLTGRSQGRDGDVMPGRTLLPRISPEEVQHALAGAQFVVSNGGTTMIHALAHGRPLVAVPLAADQSRRIRRAVKLGAVATAQSTPDAIAAAAAHLLEDAPRRQEMARRIAELGIRNGVAEAVAALVALAACR